MSLTPSASRIARGALCSALLIACSGNEGKPIVALPPPSPPPCGLSSNTQFVDDPKLVEDLGKFTAPLEPSESELDGHCNLVWQTAVEAEHCGKVVIPAFCNTCSPEAEKTRCSQDNGRGHVMHYCRIASLQTFRDNYTTCKDFTLCADKLQHASKECAAGRQ